MKHTLSGFVVASFLATSLAAQAEFFQSVDYPAGGATISLTEFTNTHSRIASGWAFYCSTGEHPVFPRGSTLTNLDTGQVWGHEQMSLLDHLERPDVEAAFKFQCANVHRYEGYELQLYSGIKLAPGRYRVKVVWDANITFRDFTLTAS
jgi:hypothetical protein